MHKLINEWTRTSQHDQQIDRNAELLEFLGTWHYAHYKPFPEKPPFWTRLHAWLSQLKCGTARARRKDQQALFNFVPWLLFVAEEDLIASYRAAYVGSICRWLLRLDAIDITDPAIDSKLNNARAATWFGSLAGMDINTFCRVNGVFGQSYRPEFRFIAEFCAMTELSRWLKDHKYRRIVIVEDIVGTGEQLTETVPALEGLKDFQILFVPLFIAPEGHKLAQSLSQQPALRHLTYEPLFVLPHECLVRRKRSVKDSAEVKAFREANRRQGKGRLGFGGDYGTLVLTHANCPDNVPPIVHERSTELPFPLFQRASREG